MKKNILLISPLSDNEALWITGNEGPDVKNNILPLGLATVAGITPAEFNVYIWDELVHGLIDDNTEFERKYDLVGVTGYTAHLTRCRQLARIWRERSVPVVIGGPGVSGKPGDYREHFDVLFIGEAERTWPQFLRDWQHGNHKLEYRQIEKIDLSESPMPRWDSIVDDLSKYAMGSVQTTRGCPFDCEFCDVIYLFGRRPRHKPIENVLEEVRVLQRHGVSNIFFSDDEFIGDQRYAKELLKALILLNSSFPMPLTFSTQLTMNLSRDEELLGLLADANFDLLFIGVETPNKESLKETNKLHNLGGDLTMNLHKILSYGMAVRAGIIVGFDHDDVGIFDMQYDFIQNAYLPSIGINMLKAPSGTKLWARLRQEGRIVTIPPAVKGKLGHPRSYTNIIPNAMTRLELMKGYMDLLDRVYSWSSFAERISGFVLIVNRRPRLLKSQEPMENVDDLCKNLNLGPDECKAVEAVIKITAEKTPYLMGRIKAYIVQHAKYRESIGRLLPQLRRQIDMESRGELAFEQDRSPLPVPAAFRKEFKLIFPDVYRRTYMNIRDKGKTAEALVEIFVDFLIKFGQTFEKFEAYHRSFLDEICDRACFKFNGREKEEHAPSLNDELQVPNTGYFHLSDDIFKSVEQILISEKKGNQRKIHYE